MFLKSLFEQNKSLRTLSRSLWTITLEHLMTNPRVSRFIRTHKISWTGIEIWIKHGNFWHFECRCLMNVIVTLLRGSIQKSSNIKKHQTEFHVEVRKILKAVSLLSLRLQNMLSNSKYAALHSACWVELYNIPVLRCTRILYQDWMHILVLSRK